MKKHSTTEELLSQTKLPYYLFLIYMCSFFLRIPARLSFLGAIRFDLLLVLLIFAMLFKVEPPAKTNVAKNARLLVIYSILVIPVVTWPGTAAFQGVPALIKSVIFFFFTYKLVINEDRLKTVVYLFIGLNTLRVIEPLYLNLAHGYWGSRTSFGWEQIERLAGSPYDVINSNGLAFVIASILPFFHYLFATGNWKRKLIYISVLPIFLYTMSLTLSRSGLLAIFMIYGIVFLQSSRKGLIIMLGTIALIVSFLSLNEHQKDRYLSIVDSDTQSSASAEGRLDGWTTDFLVAMKSPIFGHGLGASAEANWNYAGATNKSHNLWLEVLQELGGIGLILFIRYSVSIFQGFKQAKSVFEKTSGQSSFMHSCVLAMNTWLYMNLLFSLASYGLTSYEWYLFGAFSAIVLTISEKTKQQLENENNNQSC